MIPQKNDFLEYLEDFAEYDWITILDVITVLREFVKIDDLDEEFRASIDIAIELVQEGFLVAGRIGGGYFHPWSGSVAEVVERIERRAAEMLANGIDPSPGDPCWFDLASNAERWAGGSRWADQGGSPASSVDT